MSAFQLQNYVNDVQELLHDSITVSWPLARVIDRINEARLYCSMDMKCVRSLVTGGQLVNAQEIYNTAGAVVGANINTAGSNYGLGTTVPVTFSAAPAGGVTATAFGVLTNGSLTGITMTNWGSGYITTPTVTIGGVGSGASANAVTLFNALYPISLTYIFNNIRTTLRYLPFSLFQAYARILGQSFASTPGVWTYHTEQQNIYVQPPPNQNYSVEMDWTFLTTDLVNLTDFELQLRDPYQRAVQFAAAAMLFMKDQDAGRSRSDFHSANYARLVPRIVTGVGGVRVPNIYNRNFQRMVAR